MLKFASLVSDVDLTFFASLAARKIDIEGLNASAISIPGSYEIRPKDSPDSSCRLQVHGNALTGASIPSRHLRAEGRILNFNTIEEFKALDKNKFLKDAGLDIWNLILNGKILECPSLLASFSIVSYADLKKYRFHYLFAFPALHSEPLWKFRDNGDPETAGSGLHDSTSTRITIEEASSLTDVVQRWQNQVDSCHHGFFLLKKRREISPSGISENFQRGNQRVTSLWEIGRLKDFEDGFFRDTVEEDRFIAFADPSNYDSYPGWMLRNLLTLVRERWKLRQLQVLCFRDVFSPSTEPRSLIFSIEESTEVRGQLAGEGISSADRTPKITGWERSRNGKVVARTLDLGYTMEPRRLADQAVDLNLKLMKWRLAPNLNLDRFRAAKCLLLGAGTLGSYVARNLLAWGVRDITFVDNATVSFSNPVRQPLFTYQDCLNGGVQKAKQAAEALKTIYPGVNATGHKLSVPMIGHPTLDEKAATEDYEALYRLFKEKDIIFLLMDSRESRWLPTVMGKSLGKLVINAALGFDSFVVMRHGSKHSQIDKEELGCYFCNDVFAPANSMSDRTLDQQCTVTRPGVSAIASALAVELLISVLQEQYQASLPNDREQNPETSNPLGLVPHQIRGFLAEYRYLTVRGKAYECCSACSPSVLRSFEAGSWDFVQKALNEAGFLEHISGLALVQQQAEAAMSEIDLIESDDDTESMI